MMRLSVSQFCSFRWTFFQDVIQYAKFGYTSLGVWRTKLDDFELDEAAELLFEMNMDVSSLHWAGGFTGSGGLSYLDAIDDAKRAIQQANTLHAGCLLIHPGARNGHTDTHLRRILNGALSDLIPFADDYGVRLAIEPCLGNENNEWNFFRSMDEHLEFVERFPPRNLGLVLDLYHVGDQQHLLMNLASIKSRIALVQLSDFRNRSFQEENRCHLGEGLVPIQSWLKQLKSIGYTGFLELELHGFDLETTGYDLILQNSKSFLSSLSQRNPLVFS